LRKNGTLGCWGQMSDSIIQPQFAGQTPSTPRDVTGALEELALGTSHACLKRPGGALACWGGNAYGQVGVSSPELVVAPTDIGFEAKVVSVGYSHTCATNKSDRLYCWGDPLYGRLGFASTAKVAVPTAVGSDSWIALAASDTNTCGIRSDGTLHCWGFTFTDIEQLSSETTWTSLATTPNDNEYWGIKGGVPHSWSGNGRSKIPTALPGASGWVALAANSAHQCGVRSDGTLHCFGNNTNGELGDGTTIWPTATVQVGTATDWTSAPVGYTHTCGLRRSGTLFCWGANNAGQIDDGSAWSVAAVPVRL
jgi:alpha-tubulin suppressor-like RCC1 family protein